MRRFGTVRPGEGEDEENDERSEKREKKTIPFGPRVVFTKSATAIAPTNEDYQKGYNNHIYHNK